ncbi:MAG TPA: TIGR00374 family protein, partial [Myxococcales bacterium]|nr:TIGR00374 family protein [Myxococcales bacterium]
MLQMATGDGEILWRISSSALLLYSACLVLIHGLRVLRWWTLLQRFEGVSLAHINRVGAIGFMAVFMLPLRLGELARPWLLQRDSDVAFGTGLSTIAVERVIDGLMVSLLLFLVLVQMPAE